MVKQGSYQQAYNEALDEFALLLQKREKIDARLEYLRGIILGFAQLLGDEEITDSAMEETGLTRSVAKALRVGKHAYTTAEVRDELVRMGFDIKKYKSKSIIPSIAKVLKRLHEKGHVIMATVQGKTLYKWEPVQRQPLGMSFEQDELIMSAIKERKESRVSNEKR